MAARRKYDWDRLFEQDQVLLERGEDYNCSQSNIIQQIRNEASKRGLRIRLNDLDDRVIIKVLNRPHEVKIQQ